MEDLKPSLHPALLKRKILHIDMDCFFAAVEELDNPDLKGKPVAVGGSPQGRGVLCTANYEARKYGVRSAMSSSEALRRCPHLIFIKPRGKRYQEISYQIKDIFHQYTSLVEPLSLDEAFLDVTSSDRCFGSATLIAKEIKDKIFQETGLTASAGVAPNKFLAKVASDWKKPDGLFTVGPEEAFLFAQHLPLEKVPGIGKVSLEKFHSLGLKTLSDIGKYPAQWLESHFGKFAHKLLFLSQGIDERNVGGKSLRKSLGCEETYHQDLPDFDSISERIPFLVEELFERTERYFDRDQDAPKPSKIFVKAKTFDFHLHTHECPLRVIPLKIENKLDLKNQKDEILQNFEEMFHLLYNRIDKVPVRLLGLGLRMSPSPKFELEKLGQLRLL